MIDLRRGKVAFVSVRHAEGFGKDNWPNTAALT